MKTAWWNSNRKLSEGRVEGTMLSEFWKILLCWTLPQCLKQGMVGWAQYLDQVTTETWAPTAHGLLGKSIPAEVVPTPFWFLVGSININVFFSICICVLTVQCTVFSFIPFWAWEDSVARWLICVTSPTDSAKWICCTAINAFTTWQQFLPVLGLFLVDILFTRLEKLHCGVGGRQPRLLNS